MTSQTLSPAPDSPPIERLTYSVEESATALGVSRPTIYRLVARRILRPVPGIRHKRIPCQQIRRLVSSGEMHGLN
ncbi:MAG: helix-turn-helix domain-containing protein [Pseudolabrys sp.]|nr:helix-turn-helix domain-containing protein [Pseudolabrys sp.]